MDVHAQIEALERLCRSRGIPLTPQRRVVFEAIVTRGNHPTAEQVFDEVQKRLSNISKATVYRVLERLMELGLVRRVGQSGMPARFDADLRRHHHFTCRVCGRIEDIFDPQLNELPIPESVKERFVVEDFGVHFFGVCRECRETQPREPVDES